MGNANWVCFDCRQVVRRPTHYVDEVLCSHCGRGCQFLGTKIRVPTASDERAWQDLRVAVRENRLTDLERRDHLRVRRRHRLEQQIASLESRPAHEERAREIQRLRKQLEAL